MDETIRPHGQKVLADGLSTIPVTSGTVNAVVFSGSGLNDATSGGTYGGTDLAVYEVIIDSQGTPDPPGPFVADTFKWRKDSGAFTTGVSVTGGAQTLSNGVTITFAATTGHTLTDKWTIVAGGTSLSTQKSWIFQGVFAATAAANLSIVDKTGKKLFDAVPLAANTLTVAVWPEGHVLTNGFEWAASAGSSIDAELVATRVGL